jgi:hypothetical protein
MITINGNDLEREIRAAAAENPDFVYKTPVRHGDLNSLPVYFDDSGAPSCLIGQGFFRLGLTLEDMRGLNTEGVTYLQEEGVIEIELKPISWFQSVQDYQDTSGFTWRQAVENADAEKAESEAESQ